MWRTWQRGGLGAGLMLAALLLGGCATGRVAPLTAGVGLGESEVWPAPPAPARIRFVREITGRRDMLGPGTSWRRLWEAVLGVQPEDEFFVTPLAVDIDDADNILVADPGARAVFLYEHRRQTFRCLRRFGRTALVAPVAVVGTGNRGIFFVADSELRQVFAFNRRGRLVFSLAGRFDRPTGLAVSRDRLYVADARQSRVFVFTLQGQYVRSIGEPGTGPGQFNCPTHVTTDEAGNLYVSDVMNCRIQVFDVRGRFIRSLGQRGGASGRFERPKGLAVDRYGHVYVADALFDNVQVFDERGQFLLNWGEAGDGNGQFWLPTDVATSRHDLICVADSANKRIQIFAYVGQDQ